MNRDLKIIADMLSPTGLEYAFEPGGHHIKIKIRGRLVGIMPRAGNRRRANGERAMKNVVAQVRRAIRETQP